MRAQRNNFVHCIGGYVYNFGLTFVRNRKHMRVSLCQECSLIVPIEVETNYVIHICPLMASIVRTLDVEQIRDAATRAYEYFTGTRAPSKFGIELKCVSKEKLEFVPVKIVPFDEGALLLSRAHVKINTIERYFVGGRK